MNSEINDCNPLNFLGRCQNPRNIRNNRGDIVTVSCGVCPECIARRALKKKKQCSDMCSLFKYVYFYTLTYSEEYVPTCKYELIKVTNEVEGVECSYTQVKLIDNTIRNGKPSKSYGETKAEFELHTLEDNDKFVTFIEMARPHGSAQNLHTDSVRVIDNTDLQKFIKRLRFAISNLYDEKIKHFSVSEYGPKTFRPHFHGVLLFNSDKVAKNIVELVNKSWRYGNTDTQIARDCTSTSNYVAGYLNSFLYVPFFLNFKKICPRAFHSVRVFNCINREIRDFLYSKPRYCFTPFSFVKPSGIFDYIPTREGFNKLFPRCYNYAMQDRYSIQFLYKIYSKLVSEFKTDRPSDLTRACIFNYNNLIVKRFFKILEIELDTNIKDCTHLDNILLFDTSFYPSLSKSTDFTEFLKKLGFVDENYIRIYQRIYSAISLSKHFIEFCCENLSFDEVLNMTIEFNSFKKPQHNLKVMYQNMQAYCKKYNTDNYEIFYPIRSSNSFIEVIHEETGEIEYISYEKFMKRDYILQNYFKERQIEFTKQIKHKELNELNYLMFN